MTTSNSHPEFAALVTRFNKALTPVLEECVAEVKQSSSLDAPAALMFCNLTQAVVLARCLELSPPEFMLAVAKAIDVGSVEFNGIVAAHEAADVIKKMREGSDAPAG